VNSYQLHSIQVKRHGHRSDDRETLTKHDVKLMYTIRFNEVTNETKTTDRNKFNLFTHRSFAHDQLSANIVRSIEYIR
jgi:hypothetical protein